jgi:hypothetical protein
MFGKSKDRTVGVEDIDVSTAIRAKLRKPGACGVFSLQVKYDPASLLKCNATLIIDDIQYSRKSWHDRYEFRTVPFTITCWKLHFHHPKL